MMENDEPVGAFELIEPTLVHKEKVMAFWREYMEIGEYVFHGTVASV